MRQQVADGDVLPRLRRAFEKFADPVVHAQPAVLYEDQYSGRNQLLADRADLVDRFGSRRNVEFRIRQPVATGLDDLPVLDDRDRYTGDALSCHLRSDKVVDLVGTRCGRRD